MSHSCPECGQVCYCGGDIDDCLFEGTREERLCGHCEEAEDDDDGFWDDDDPEQP